MVASSDDGESDTDAARGGAGAQSQWAGDEETRRYMRVLHEELIGRLRTMGEGIDELRGRS